MICEAVYKASCVVMYGMCQWYCYKPLVKSQLILEVRYKCPHTPIWLYNAKDIIIWCGLTFKIFII